jgi:glycosyltransferase involved in cell wall biosynthesis
MQVGALIKDTIWLPAAYADGPPPALSVLLPTFRRGADGLFLEAARSVLDQSERNLELIIVDDGSTDGTADQIDALRRADGRVSCLRHPFNIGLPAVSSYEAFVRARAPYIALAFDDFFFEPDALGRLLGAAERRHGAVVHGQADLHLGAGQVRRLGQDSAVCERLAYENYFANSSFVIPRGVIEDVGFYDPHITMARLCDWDLWRRIIREYPMFCEDVFVGHELGPSRPDSLGRTYPLYYEAVNEYVGRDRNTALRPANYEAFDVWEMPPASSACLAEHVLLTRRFLRNKAWARGHAVMPAEDRAVLDSPGGRCVGVATRVQASSSLCFDGLLDRYGGHLLFVPPYVAEFSLQLFIARCDAVILVRELLQDHGQRIALACKAMAVPLYYLIDDNLILVGEEDPDFAVYTRDRVVGALADFAGVLCTSRPLAEYLRALRITPAIEEIGPVFDATRLRKMERLAVTPPGPALRVGFVGGEFRQRSLEADVLPALAAVATEEPVALFSRVPPVSAARWPFEVSVIPFTDSFDGFLTTWRPVGLDVLVHPRGDTANSEYKTASVLLSALYLGAVPIVAREPVFDGLGEEQGVIAVDGDRESWEQALRRARAGEGRRELLSRLEAFCRSYFSPDRNARVLEGILASSPPTDILTWGWRLRQARESPAGLSAEIEREAEARAVEVARIEHEAQVRATRVRQLEEASAALAERVERLAREAEAREARLAALERDALDARVGTVGRVLRRLGFRS